MGQIDERCENQIRVSQTAPDDAVEVQCNATGAQPCKGCGMPVCEGCKPEDKHNCQKLCYECGDPTNTDLNSPMYGAQDADGNWLCAKCAWALKQ